MEEKIIDKLEECVDEIQFSLDGATAPVNDKIRGTGVYHKVLESIRLFDNTKIKRRLSMVLMPQNVKNFQDHVEQLAELLENVELKFSFAITEGRADKTIKFSSPDAADRELQKILRILYKKRLKAMKRFEPNLVVRNCGYGEVITIAGNGDIYPCAVFKKKYGNIRTGNFPGIIKKIQEDMVSSNVENLAKCPDCDLQYICFGGCRLNNITYNRSLLEPHCNQQKKDEFYRRLVVRDDFDALSIWLGKISRL